MSAMSSMRVSGISPIAAMNSNVVPGWSRTAAREREELVEPGGA